MRTFGNRTASSDTPNHGRSLNRLTDLKVKSFINQARAGTAPTKKLSDGGGMYLALTAAGTPVWRVKYRFDGNERLFAVGTYSDFSLERARAERDRIKALLRQGRDPVQSRRLDRATEITASGETFRAVAMAWLEKQKGQWSEIHYTKSRRALERDVLNRIGDLPIKDITSKMVAGVVEAILKRGVRETAVKILQHINGVFRLAQVRGLRDNPADAVSEILPAKSPTRPMPALLTWPALGDILRRADAASVSRPVRMAHRLCALSLARISNVVEADWAEFALDGDVPIWTIPRAKMKSKDKRHAHKIILAPTIAAELRGWQAIVGDKGMVFPSPQGGKHISRESIEKVYRVTLGLADRHTPHGWRSAFSTLARDEGFDRDVVELVLDHVYDTDVVRAYDRGERLQQRIKLMYWWGEQLRQAQENSGPMVSDSAQAVYRVRRPRIRRPRVKLDASPGQAHAV